MEHNTTYRRKVNTSSGKKTKKELLSKTWENLNSKFPNWKNNKILKNNKNMKNLYIRSVNKITFKIYSYILR